MGISTNSHGKKSDKETQSPLLKIFQDIMMREDNDPEKRNLLVDQEKKRKQYTVARVKGNRRSCESSSSEHRKRSPYQSLSTEQRLCNVASDKGSEKKSRWWKKEGKSSETLKKDDDTCSCVSCALRRIVGSEYACIACLLLLFSISIIAAFCLVYKNVPQANASSQEKIVTTTEATTEYELGSIGDSDRLKRKIDIINENLIKNDLNEQGVYGKPYYDAISSDPMDLPGSSDIDFGPSLRELNLIDGKTKRHGDSDFHSIMEQTISDQSNDKLKEFYKKLVQTDGMIKNLRKMKFNSQNNEYGTNFDIKSHDRFKRSLKVFTNPNKYRFRRHRRNIHIKSTETSRNKKQRLKRFSNDTDEPTGFVIEKKKLIVQYKPLGFGKLVPNRCSHVPKESHVHHEHHLKHPFYQNTQRLDELLDRFLNKNLPELVADPFGFDSLFQREKNKCKHPNPTKNINIVKIGSEETTVSTDTPSTETATMKGFKNKMAKTTKQYNNLHNINSNITHKYEAKIKYGQAGKADKVGDDFLKGKRILYNFDLPPLPLPEGEKTSPEVSTSHYERKFYEHEADMLKKEEVTLVTGSPNDFELLLSVSTIMNPEIGETPVAMTESEIPLINRVPNIRRLMQLDGEEEENLGYEDFKEVLTDNMENEDDNERKGERKKRKYDAEREVNNEPPWFTKLSSILVQTEEEEKTTPTEIALSDWSSVIAQTPPFSNTKEVYQKELQFSPPNSINNPNWKGPMPLYPDELSSMLKDQADKTNILTNQRQPTNRMKRKRTDLEYIEDYLDNKYDRLVEMAQAYSDYGVLEGKKDNMRNEKHPATNNKISGVRVKLSVEDESHDDNRDLVALQKKYSESYFYPFGSNKDTTSTTIGGMFRILNTTPHKPTTTNNSEGFRVEVRPTQGAIEDSIISKLLQSHIKIDNPKKALEKVPGTQDLLMFPEMEQVYNPKLKVATNVDESKKKYPSEKEMLDLPSNLFTINKKRSLLSTLFRKSDYSVINNNLGESVTDGYSENNNEELGTTMNVLDKSKFKSKRDTEMTNRLKKFFKTNNRHLKNIVTKLNDENKYSNGEQSIVFLKPRVRSEANEIIDYISQVTLNNVRLFSSPYLYNFVQYTTEPLTAVDAPTIFLYEPNPNITTDIEDFYQITNNQNGNILSTERSKLNPIDIGRTGYQPQYFMTSPRSSETNNVKVPFKKPFYALYETNEPSAVTNNPEGTSTLVLDTFQLANEFKRLKRNAGTGKTMLEKSDVTIHDTPLGITEVHKNISVNDPQVSINLNTTGNSTANNATISDFFMMISNWFKTLEGIKVDDKPSVNSSAAADLTNLLLQFNNRPNETTHKTRSTTTEVVYPLYDSDMIENIGHRSRVLLTIQEQNTTESATRIGIDNNEVIKENSANVSEYNDSSTLTTLKVHISINKTTPEKHKATIYSVPEKDNSTRKKVKRNADDSNLISWNDIYDDEYGIQTDNFNSIKDKYCKEREFIKRSGRWVQDKIKKFADNLKSHEPELVGKKRTSRTVENVGIVQKLKDYYQKCNRQSAEVEYGTDQKTVFNVLQANMVEACRKAANAVKLTRNVDVKETPDQGTIAASLMQQLVRLLTDVVDYQVEQKTCSQLPPDLKQFLEWLTRPEEQIDENPVSNIDNDTPEPLIYKTTQLDTGVDAMEELMRGVADKDFSSTTENVPPLYKENDFKSQYLDALRAVQELLDQYEEMGDDEKSKMTGVKLYLENQLRLLNKQLSGYEFYTLYEKNSMPLRYKRGFHPRNLQQRSNRKHYKFVRNFGKKHTRTTAAYYDGMHVSEMKRIKQDSDKDKAREHNNKRFKLTIPKRNGRNLKDIYYKAVAEAKKYSTALTKGHKRQQSHDHTVTTQAYVS